MQGPQGFWRLWEELELWRDGPPDEDEMGEGLTLIEGILSQIQALTPTTKKETKAVEQAKKKLNREKRNLGEQFFRITRLEPLREMMEDIHDMEEDGPDTIAAKLNKLREMDAAWTAIAS